MKFLPLVFSFPLFFFSLLGFSPVFACNDSGSGTAFTVLKFCLVLL